MDAKRLQDIRKVLEATTAPPDVCTMGHGIFIVSGSTPRQVQADACFYRQAWGFVKELLDDNDMAHRWSAAWKAAAKDHKRGRHLAAHLFAKHLMMLVEANAEIERLQDEVKQLQAACHFALQAVERCQDERDVLVADGVSGSMDG